MRRSHIFDVGSTNLLSMEISSPVCSFIFSMLALQTLLHTCCAWCWRAACLWSTSCTAQPASQWLTIHQLRSFAAWPSFIQRQGGAHYLHWTSNNWPFGDGGQLQRRTKQAHIPQACNISLKLFRHRVELGHRVEQIVDAGGVFRHEISNSVNQKLWKKGWQHSVSVEHGKRRAPPGDVVKNWAAMGQFLQPSSWEEVAKLFLLRLVPYQSCHYP